MRHLWLAIREGLYEHRRALLQLAGGVVALALVLQLAFFFASTASSPCATCHIMKPFVERW
jgi:hypothetical protein